MARRGRPPSALPPSAPTTLTTLDPENLDLSNPLEHAEILRQVHVQLWSKGDLRYRLKATQQIIHKRLTTAKSRRHYLMCSRRLGKTDLLFTRACEVALKKPKARILYLAPHAKDAALLAQDTAEIVFRDCPDSVRPDYSAQEREFRFHNGSVIRLKGTNGEHAQFLRGGAYDLVILDEAGLMDDFRHVLNDIVGPMVMTTRGSVYIATTPPRSPGHESISVYEQYATLGDVSLFTIRDADDAITPFEEKCRALVDALEDPAQVADIIRGKLEPTTTTAKREYFCQIVTDANTALVPEFTKAIQNEIVREYERPPFFDYYCGIDPGTRDNTGIVYAYVDFLSARLVVDDEALLVRPNTNTIVQTIHQIETTTFSGKVPKARVSDTDLRLIQDLRQLHDLSISPARKDDMLASVQMLRHLIQTRRLVINPRCVHLTRQLQNAVWNNKGTDMARAGEASNDAHYDLIPALRYLIRSIDWKHNPYPSNWTTPGAPGGPPVSTWISPKNTGSNQTQPHLQLRNIDTPLTRLLARRTKTAKFGR